MASTDPLAFLRDLKFQEKPTLGDLKAIVDRAHAAAPDLESIDVSIEYKGDVAVSVLVRTIHGGNDIQRRHYIGAA